MLNSYPQNALSSSASIGRDRSTAEGCPLFSGLLPQECAKMSAAARTKQFARGEMLYVEGESVQQVFLLTSGIVKITQLGPKGSEVILKLATPGDVLGAVGLLSTGGHCTTAHASRLCRVLVWEAQLFKALVDHSPVLHQNLVRILGAYLLELQERFREVATERVEPRVARQLMRLLKTIGQPANGAVEIGLSREQLAQMTGTTLFTVSRLLSSWEARGFVRRYREGVVICDIPSLNAISVEG